MLGTFSSNLLRGGKHTNCNTENSIQAGKFPFFLWWPRLSAEAVQAPSLHIFQRHPGTALSSLRLLPAPATRSVGSCFTLRSWKMSTINMNFIGFSPSPAPGQVSGVSYTLLLLSLEGEGAGLPQKSSCKCQEAEKEGTRVGQGGFAAVAAAPPPARPRLALLAFTWTSSWTKGTGLWAHGSFPSRFKCPGSG